MIAFLVACGAATIIGAFLRSAFQYPREHRPRALELVEARIEPHTRTEAYDHGQAEWTPEHPGAPHHSMRELARDVEREVDEQVRTWAR